MSGRKIYFIILIPPLLIIAMAYWWGSYEKKRDHQYDAIIAAACDKYNVDPSLVRAVIWRESDFDPKAKGLAKERGLMQVTPPAGQEWADHEKIKNYHETDLWDPRTNIYAGTWYLSRSISRWKDTDVPKIFALAEYNAGRSNALRWARNLPEKTGAIFIEQIDFPTTKNYILSVLDYQYKYQNQPDPPIIDVISEKLIGYWWRWIEKRQIEKIKSQKK